AQQSACENQLNDATSRVNGLETRRRAGWVMFGVGSGVAVVGVLLLVLQRDPFDHAHEARDEGGEGSLFAGWRLVPALSPGSAFLSATRSF
ncbi:MAG TPA: hypothetical protein VH044_17050, partial [Polyangiaceae bacterium]|nr:hypothetical protein [Polyangiaceae bacterium]